MTVRMKQNLFSIGHSTRSLEEMINLLKENKIKRLVDIRSVPMSRYNPQFNIDTLPLELSKRGLKFSYLGTSLGGWKKSQNFLEVNSAWKKKSFRGYADYMQTRRFELGIKKLLGLSEKGNLAFMCAEAVPWRCHRWLVSDALIARGLRVIHIGVGKKGYYHELTAFGKIRDGKVVYRGKSQVAVGE